MDRYETPYGDRLAVHAKSNGAAEGDNYGIPPSPVDDALHLIQILGSNSRLPVAVGATSQFGEWLGWPKWLKQSTSLSEGPSLPDRIALADDLIIIANIVEHREAASIIARLFEDFKIPGAPITVPALYNAPTLQEALEFFVRTAAFGSPFLQIDISRDHKCFSIVINSELRRGALRDFCSIAILSVAYRFISFFVSDAIAEARIEIEADIGSDLAKPLARLPGRVSFGADRYSVHGDLSWLPISNVRSDKAFWNFALERMAVAERQGMQSDLVNRIRAAVCAAMDSEARVPRLKQIAALEGVSERTLVRTLAAQGIKFHQIVEEERRIKAAELIGNASFSLTEVAAMLGFTDMSSFGRSYRQWFGVTPGQARSRRNA